MKPFPHSACIAALALASLGAHTLVAQTTTVCANSNANPGYYTDATCPLGTYGGGVPYTVSISGTYSCPTMTGNYVSQTVSSIPYATASATGACNGIGGQFAPNVSTGPCPGGSNWCYNAYYQSIGLAPWAPLLPWPTSSVIFGSAWACWPTCMTGCEP
jgi:hypothetical protein